MERKDAHQRVVGKGALGWKPKASAFSPRLNAPAPTREANKATPCQWGLQPRTAQGSFLETFTPTLPHSRRKFQGFSRSPGPHPLLAGRRGGAAKMRSHPATLPDLEQQFPVTQGPA